MNGDRIAELRVPRVVAEVAERMGFTEPPYCLEYPMPQHVSAAAVAVWLIEYRSDDGKGLWRVGVRDNDPQGPMAVARRLLFWQWIFKTRYLARGGRVDAALRQEATP